MHLRLLPIRLIIPLLFLGSLPGYSQPPAPSRPAFTPTCIARTMDRPCPSANVPFPYLAPQPLTFESMEREAAFAQAQRASAPRPTLLRAEEAPQGTAEATFQLQRSTLPDPDAPDQSELLKNSKDRDFILRNFKTMYVTTGDIKYFDEQQMKAALMRNPDFKKLNIRIVSDRRFADVYLVVSYTFAWDYPFELRHQNTTTALLAGKGEGPFSGPLGAADVARVFVELAKPWRTPEPKK